MFEKKMSDLTPDEAYRKLLLILIAFLSLFFIFLGGYTEWILGLIVLLLMCMLIASEVSSRSRDMSFWERDNELDSELNMNLKEISSVADRAYSGKKVSKARLEERIIKEFLGKVKTIKGLSDDEVKKMLNDPEELKEKIDDDRITSFILNSKSFTDIVHEKSIHEQSVNRWSTLKKKLKIKKKETKDEGYKDRINEILERMEEWN
ncbi:MAG: hypothetical protein ACOC5D_00895 [Thermoplasmatota archaeon]